ncbi:MAG: SDR family NAD(P)-dependent oxidoreductase, partial [Acidobacteriota bacterium]
ATTRRRGALMAADVAIDWAALHGGAHRRRLPLPTYPFERARFFVDPDEKLASVFAAKTSFDKIDDPDRWLYAPSWRGWRPAAGAPASSAAAGGPTLVFCRADGASAALAARLADDPRFAPLIRVVPGQRFAAPMDGGAALRYALDPAALDDYARLVGDLADHGRLPRRVLHLWPLDDDGPAAGDRDAFDIAQRDGFYSLLFLVRALGQAARSGPLALDVVTRGAVEVTGAETRRPARATCLGVVLSASQEYADLDARLIDVDDALAVDAAGSDVLLRTLAAPIDDALLAVRGRRVFKPDYDPIEPSARSTSPAAMPLRDAGVYVITGGLGGIGLAIAAFLHRAVGARLVLTGRTGVPARAEWDAWLATHAANERVAVRIRRLQRLEADGASVIALAADVGDRDQMTMVFDQAQAQFGRVDGVVHAAGHVADGLLRPIADATVDQCLLHFHPKAHGLYVLAETMPADLDFCLVTSSLAALLGGIGGASYAAANAFADAWIEQRAQTHPSTRWLSLDWDAWLPHEGSPEADGPRPAWARFALTPEEGIAVLQRALTVEDASRLVISTTDLDARLRRIRADDADAADGGVDSAPQPARHSRPDQNNAYVAPRTPREAELAEIWQMLLGIDGIGVHDNFFRLGGDSLVAIQLATRLRDAYGVELSVDQLFDEPTIAGLAEKLTRLQRDASADDAAIADDDAAADAPARSPIALDALEAVEKLSDAEVQRMLAALDGRAAPAQSSMPPTTVIPPTAIQPPAAQAPATQPPATPPPRIVEDRYFALAPGVFPDKRDVAGLYDMVTAQLSASEFGRHAVFLNWGYVPNHHPSFSAVQLADTQLNRNAIRLVLETVADIPLGPDDRILDVACGRGGTIRVFRDFFDVGRAVGLDLSPAAVAFCRARHGNDNTFFLHGDAERLPFADGAMTVVTNLESSHCYPDIHRFYREVYRVLAPGGHFAYTDVWPAPRVEALEDALRATGFTFLRRRDITSNVLLSCDDIANRNRRLFAGNDAQIMGNFLAAPGSALYNGMENGSQIYLSFQLRKPA